MADIWHNSTAQTSKGVKETYFRIILDRKIWTSKEFHSSTWYKKENITLYN